MTTRATPLTLDDLAAAWRRGQDGRGQLAKGSVSSPGLPIAPHPIKPRAPRTPAPFDPVEDVKKPAAPYEFKPHRLGDLYQLHLQDAYPKTPQRSPRPRTPTPPGGRLTIRHLLTAISRLRPGLNLPSPTGNVTPF